MTPTDIVAILLEAEDIDPKDYVLDIRQRTSSVFQVLRDSFWNVEVKRGEASTVFSGIDRQSDPAATKEELHRVLSPLLVGGTIDARWIVAASNDVHFSVSVPNENLMRTQESVVQENEDGEFVPHVPVKAWYATATDRRVLKRAAPVRLVVCVEGAIAGRRGAASVMAALKRALQHYTGFRLQHDDIYVGWDNPLTLESAQACRSGTQPGILVLVVHVDNTWTFIPPKPTVQESGPTFATLKKHKVKLEPEERTKAIEAGATWHKGPNGEATCAIWKSVVNGKTYFGCNTHRAYAAKRTLAAAINAYHDVVEPSA